MQKVLAGFCMVLLTVALVCSSATPVASAPQQTTTPPSVKLAHPMKRLLDATSALYPVMKEGCRTQQCTDLVNQAITLITNAQQDDANGVLTGTNAHNFLENLKTVTAQIHNEMMNSLTPAEQEKLKEQCKSCQRSMSLTVPTPEARMKSAVYHPSDKAHFQLAQCTDRGTVPTVSASVRRRDCHLLDLLGLQSRSGVYLLWGRSV